MRSDERVLLILVFLTSLNLPVSSHTTDSLAAQMLSYADSVSNCNCLYSEEMELLSNRWRSKCGESEPVARLKVINRFQQDTNGFHQLFCRYLSQYFTVYQKRVRYMHRGANSMFLIYDEELDYLPMENTFDPWCEAEAEMTLAKVNTESEQYLAALLFSAKMELFDSVLKEERFLHWRTLIKQVQLNKRISFGQLYEVGAGVRLPLNTSFFNTSQYVCFNFGLIKKRASLYLKLSLWSVASRTDVSYLYNREIRLVTFYQGNSIGLHGEKLLFFGTRRTYLSVSCGVAQSHMKVTLAPSANHPQINILHLWPSEFDCGTTVWYAVSKASIGFAFRGLYSTAGQDRNFQAESGSYFGLIGITFRL